MAQATWEKSAIAPAAPSVAQSGRWKYMLGGLLILSAVIILIANGMASGARFYVTVDEVVNDPAYAGQTVRVTGAVIGETIFYDPENLIIEFTVANIPQQVDDIGQALHDAVNDPNATRMHVRVENQVKPELLQHEAQAIMTGYLGEDGVFYLTDVLQTKCPSRFIEAGPDQSIAQPGA
jgi:cytochrome c-type biogenesis protein CcmE